MTEAPAEQNMRQLFIKCAQLEAEGAIVDWKSMAFKVLSVAESELQAKTNRIEELDRKIDEMQEEYSGKAYVENLVSGEKEGKC